MTGAAGFVGFHLAKDLAMQRDNLVVAFDDFNSYYDVKLKIVSIYSVSRFLLVVLEQSINFDAQNISLLVTFNVRSL